jgi:HSP20 family protein
MDAIVRNFGGVWDELGNVFYPVCIENVQDSFIPAVDIVAGDTEYKLLVELPGLKEKDFSLEVKDGVLSIKGSRPELTDEKFKTVRRERGFGEFERTFELPVDVSAEGIEGRFTNGLLEIILPRKEESKPRKIEIQ